MPEPLGEFLDRMGREGRVVPFELVQRHRREQLVASLPAPKPEPVPVPVPVEPEPEPIEQPLPEPSPPEPEPEPEPPPPPPPEPEPPSPRTVTPFVVTPAAQRVSWHARQYLHLTDYGAIGDGVADDTTAVLAWIEACWQQQLAGYAAPGTYFVTSCINYPEADLELHFHRNAIVKGAADLFVNVLHFDGGSFRPSIRFYGGQINNSLRGFISADASGTALGFTRMTDVLVEGTWLMSTDYRDEKGDSGITTVNCLRVTVRKCYFQGQPDAGVYFSGGSSTGSSDDYGDHVLDDCLFYRCAGAGAMKRQGRRTKFTNNTVIECRAGFGFNTLPGTPDITTPDITAAREVIVTNNFFKRIGSRAISADYPCKLIFANNEIEDWGYDPEGVLTGALFQWAADLTTTNALCTGNMFSFADWDPAPINAEAFRVQQSDIDTVLFPPTGNLIDNNAITNVTIGIKERAGATGNGGDNFFSGVTTPVVLENAASTSKYGVRKDDGTNQPFLSTLAVGKTAFSVADNVPGFGVGPATNVWHTFDGTGGGSVSGYRMNRTGADGAYLRFYRDGVAQAGSLSSSASGVVYSGIYQSNDHGITTLPPASSCMGMMLFVRDGAGAKPAVVSDGTIWRYMDGTAV